MSEQEPDRYVVTGANTSCGSTTVEPLRRLGMLRIHGNVRMPQVWRAGSFEEPFAFHPWLVPASKRGAKPLLLRKSGVNVQTVHRGETRGRRVGWLYRTLAEGMMNCRARSKLHDP